MSDMRAQPSFVGLGAQKAGTSWIYACLVEHPHVCMPRKELHFFSRERQWQRGYEWYEEQFAACRTAVARGEFSTSYLEDPLVPERIKARYPAVKLIASLRNPSDRAYSNYLNDVMSGAVRPDTGFRGALKTHPEYIERGRYATQLRRYLAVFSREQLLVLVYEEALRDPYSFVRSIYEFLGVDHTFNPSMLHRRVAEGRVPRFVWLDQLLVRGSHLAQRSRLRGLWWSAKKAGFGDAFRRLNTRREQATLQQEDRQLVTSLLSYEIEEVEALLSRSLAGWRT